VRRMWRSAGLDSVAAEVVVRSGKGFCVLDRKALPGVPPSGTIAAC